MKVHTFKQYSDPYWAAHRGRPSMSNTSKIITPAKGDFSKSAIEYGYELIAEMYDHDYGMYEDYATAAMKNGTILEPEARRFYEFERDCKVEQVGLIETDDGRFIGSPDALIGDEGGLELKSPTIKTHIRYLDQGGLPAEYKPQVNGYLHISGRPWWDFYSHCRGLPPVLVRVEPSDYTKKLGDALDKFWEMFMELRAKIEGGREEVVAAAIAASNIVIEQPAF